MKKKTVKSLHNKAEALWKEVCFLRDGRSCQVQKTFPTLATHHIGPLQVDHCITRANKHFFLDPRNGTVVCASCNRLKHYKIKSVDRAIERIVRKREGKWLDDAIELDMTKGPNLSWSKISWIEQQIRKLKRIKKKLEEREGEDWFQSSPS